MMQRLVREIRKMQAEKGPLLIAIDGRCASGKTTLAEKLGKELSCNVIHMDDFFLRPEQRTPSRYAEPGGNVDRERFVEAVILPLKAGKCFSYRPFDCRTMQLGESIPVIPSGVTIIEGTYSCHPALWDYYDYHIFMTVSANEQRARIAARNWESAEAFFCRWIPLEERYFSAFDVERKCERKMEA